MSPCDTCKRKALVVAACPSRRLDLAEALGELGFEVDQTSEALAGLGTLLGEHCDCRQRYAVVFVDESMPGMDGIELLVEIRRQTDLVGLVVMVLFDDEDVLRISRALDAGADDYVLEPLLRGQLKAKLRRLGLV